MADVKITALPAISSVSLADVIPIVDDVAGTPATTKATITQVRAALVPVVLTADVSGTLPVANGGTGITSLGSGVATFLGTPSGANLGSALTTALAAVKVVQATGTGFVTVTSGVLDAASSAVGTGVMTFLATPSGANLASALTTALPDTKGGTGLTALGTGVATALGTFSSANIATACTDETGTGSLVFGTAPLFKTTINMNGPGSSTFKYLITPANIAADRTLTLPLLAGNDTLVCEAFAATLTNKTIDLTSNTLTCTSAQLKTACTDETGSGGALVFATSPTIDAPTLSGLPVLSGASASTSNDAKGTAVDVNPVHVQTTDATVTTLDSFTIASNSAAVVSWLVTGIKSDSSQAAAYSCTACFKNNAGTVAQVGTTTTTVIGESDAAWDATVDNSTTTIRLRITGKAATTVQWTSILTRLTVIP